MNALKSNLQEAPVITGRGGAIQMLITPKSVGSKQVAMGFSRLEMYEKVEAHVHDYSEEAFFVLQGKGVVHMLDENEFEIGRIAFTQHDAVLIPKGIIHWIENVGDIALDVVFVVAPLAPKPELGHRSIKGKSI